MALDEECLEDPQLQPQVRGIAPLLNISQEGKLQRDISDIVEELDMMIHVIMKQRDIIKSWREKDELIWFRKQAYYLISGVGDRIAEFEGSRKSAESTSHGITVLLDLKQQQASILQAWRSARQADESVRQGRSIMTFAIVTIIVLPVSFILSVFGMNHKDIGDTNMTFGDTNMTFGDQVVYMLY
ncbi:uncharacterized protein LY79DRAFT_583091 [Colletotrichum navitas]|uniref:Ankyrin repeat protein n=1 Tax=Colletotrichum navitas TaxID=681940 RepID=A0AAD8PPY3_9PEZI|nr:uncharacterized protein LY79DRAFT_583091 [Colletotrichum navitas]KAK1574240.1 hypothetical protein LY79DRAFT_583091 [Colletotrichum navitas]